MKNFVFAFAMACIYLSCAAQNHPEADSLQFDKQGIRHDSFQTPAGRNVDIYFIKHASLVFNIDGFWVYIDPVAIYGTDFSSLPKADLIAVTHSHHDHLDPTAIAELRTEDTKLFGGGDVAQQDTAFRAIKPGDMMVLKGPNFTINATAAYNTTPGHLQFHPKDRGDVGLIFDIDGMRIYVAGDTEDIPEMNHLGKIDIAFLPVNQPYTMTPEQAIHATEMIKPSILYPYHYSDTDLSPIVEKFKDDKDIRVRIRQLE